MARIFQSVCDVHQLREEIEIIEGDELFGFNGDWYTFGICKTDRERLTLAEFEALVMEHGIKLKKGELPPEMRVKKAGKATQPVQPTLPGHEAGPDQDECLWCTWTGTASAMAEHAKTKHGFSTLTEALGGTCPVCGQEGFTLLGRHAGKHNAHSSPHLFMIAAAMGDPLGIVALRKKAAR